jgi:hypothetical protein
MSRIVIRSPPDRIGPGTEDIRVAIGRVCFEIVDIHADCLRSVYLASRKRLWSAGEVLALFVQRADPVFANRTVRAWEKSRDQSVA